MNQRFDRFKDAPWFMGASSPNKDLLHPVVGGAGGIGSWLTMLLVRAGFQPIVFDFDTVDPVNMAGQLFPFSGLGKPKVEALQEVVKSFTDSHLLTFNEKITKDSGPALVSISCFDNMKARKDMYEVWKAANGSNPNAIYIDGRLTAEQLQIFCIVGGKEVDMNTYEAIHLFDDSEVEDAPCTMKQTSHAAAMIASHMVGFYTNHVTNIMEKEVLRAVPFSYEYFIPMSLTSEL